MLSYCWKTLKLRVPCSLVKGKIILIYYNHSTPHFKKLLKRASRVTIWHHFTNLQLQWKNRAFFLVPFSSQQLYLVCVYTLYMHIHIRLVCFEVQQETNTALLSIKEKNRRPSCFQKFFFLNRIVQHEIFIICNSKELPEVSNFECVFTFIVHLFSKLFGTVF